MPCAPELRAAALDVSLAIDYPRDLAQRDRRSRAGAAAPAATGNDDLAESDRVLDTALDAHQLFLAAARDGAGRHVEILIAQSGNDLLDAYAQRGHCSGIQQDLDLALGPAGEFDRTYAAHIFQALPDHLVGHRRELT